AMSAVVSLTLTPMMAARLLKAEHGAKHGRLYRASDRVFQWMHDSYARSLSWVLEHDKLMLVVTLVTVGFTVWLYVVIPKGLFPQQDTGSPAAGTQAPQDISFPAFKARTEAVLKVIAEDPNIDHFVSFMGQGNQGFMFLQLKPIGKGRSI